MDWHKSCPGVGFDEPPLDESSPPQAVAIANARAILPEEIDVSFAMAETLRWVRGGENEVEQSAERVALSSAVGAYSAPMMVRAGAGAVVLWALLACKSSATPTLTNAELGTLKRSGGKIALDSPTRRLPRVAAARGDIEHSFGVCFDYTKGEGLGTVEVVVHPPGAIKTLRIESGQKVSPGEIRLRAPSFSGSGQFCQDMYFDDDDPLGTWSFDLVRDGKTLQSWKLEVYAP